METQEWKWIKGYEGLYQVSNLGNIKSFYFKTPREIFPAINSKGYYQINLWKNKKRKLVLISRIVCEAFHPNPENKSTVNHIDFNRANNNSLNLEWATQSENMRHAMTKPNCKNVGINHYRSKLTETDVKEILRLKGKKRQLEIGEIYGLCQGDVSRIHNGKTWKHIEAS